VLQQSSHLLEYLVTDDMMTMTIVCFLEMIDVEQ
jgi:hypothetical protein